MKKWVGMFFIVGIWLAGCNNSNILLKDTMKMNTLVNKQNTLPKKYEPKELVVPNVSFAEYANSNTMGMHPEAAEALERMFEAAKGEGVTLLAVSGYRSYEYQENLYQRQKELHGQTYVDQYVAKPGQSEHQTGLAMDIDSPENTQLTEAFQYTNAYKWLQQNSMKYGFIIRYEEGKEEITGYHFEPWHIRYVGIETATQIIEKEMTLEEYWE